MGLPLFERAVFNWHSVHCNVLSGKLPLGFGDPSMGGFGEAHVSIFVSLLVSETVDDLGSCGCCGCNSCDCCCALQDLRTALSNTHKFSKSLSALKLKNLPSYHICTIN